MNNYVPAQRCRRIIAVFDDYAAAERAVDRLSDLRFPVERVAILGHDLQMVEQGDGPAELRRCRAEGNSVRCAARRLDRLVIRLVRPDQSIGGQRGSVRVRARRRGQRRPRAGLASRSCPP